MTYQEILAVMEEEYTRAAGHAPEQAADIGIRLRILATQLAELYNQVEELQYQAFPQTATGEMLAYHAAVRGITPKQAVKATGGLLFYRDTSALSGIDIPAGTLCQTTGGEYRFETTEDGVLTAGETQVLVPAQAVEGGAGANVGAGAVSGLVTVIQGLAGVANPQPFRYGVDPEGDEQLRQRLMEHYAAISNGANPSFYYQIAMGRDEVYSAKVLPRHQGRGTVKVAVAGQGSAVTPEVVQALREEIESRKEIAVDLEVAAAQPVAVDIQIQLLPEDLTRYEDAADTVREKLAQGLLGRRVGEPLRRVDLYRILGQVEGILNYVVVLPQTDIRVQQDQLVVLGNLTTQRMEAGI